MIKPNTKSETQDDATMTLFLTLAQIQGVEFTEERLQEIAPVFQTLTRLLERKNPRNAREHIKNTASKLGIDAETYLEKILKKLPNLLYRNPSQIERRFNTNARALGLDTDAYRPMVLKDPQQLDVLPDTLRGKIRLFEEFNKQGILENPIIDRLRSQPHILRWSSEHIILRLEYAKAMRIQHSPSFGILSGSRENTEILLVEHFGHSGMDYILYANDNPELLKLARRNLFDCYSLESGLT